MGLRQSRLRSPTPPPSPVPTVSSVSTSEDVVALRDLWRDPPLPVPEGRVNYYTVYPVASVPGIRTGVWTCREGYVPALLLHLLDLPAHPASYLYPWRRHESRKAAIAYFGSNCQAHGLDSYADLNFVSLHSLPEGEPEWDLPLLAKQILQESALPRYLKD